MGTLKEAIKGTLQNPFRSLKGALTGTLKGALKGTLFGHVDPLGFLYSSPNQLWVWGLGFRV